MIMKDSKILPNREANAADFKNKTNKNSCVTKYTRAGKNGKQIVCPECESIRRVYHFNFSGLTCPECKQSVDKYSWKVLTVQGQLGSDSNNNRRED